MALYAFDGTWNADEADPYVAPHDADLYLFANDMPSKYGNNKGSLMVTITRTG